MTTSSPSFSSLGGLSRLTIILFYVSIALSAIIIIFYSYNAVEISTLNNTNIKGMDAIYANEWLLYIIGQIYQIVILIRTITLLIWYYRAYKNLKAIGARALSSSPLMAVIWFFIPVFNLWKPYYRLQEIWKASVPKTVLITGQEWKNNASSRGIKIFWVTGIVFAVFSFTGYLIYYSALPTTGNVPSMSDLVMMKDAITLATMSFIAAEIILIISAVYAIKIIKQISDWQLAIIRK